MDQQYLFVSCKAVYRIEKGPLTLIRQMPMIPAYHNVEAGNSCNGHVTRIVTLLGGDDTRLQVSLGQFLYCWKNPIAPD